MKNTHILILIVIVVLTGFFYIPIKDQLSFPSGMNRISGLRIGVVSIQRHLPNQYKITMQLRTGSFNTAIGYQHFYSTTGYDMMLKEKPIPGHTAREFHKQAKNYMRVAHPVIVSKPFKSYHPLRNENEGIGMSHAMDNTTGNDCGHGRAIDTPIVVGKIPMPKITYDSSGRPIIDSIIGYQLLIDTSLWIGKTYSVNTDMILTHNVCLGRHAGWNLTVQDHVIIIGDYEISDNAQYKSCTLNYKDDWTFFETNPGKRMKKMLSQYPQGQPLPIETIHQISNVIFIDYLKDINNWVELHFKP